MSLCLSYLALVGVGIYPPPVPPEPLPQVGDAEPPAAPAPTPPTTPAPGTAPPPPPPSDAPATGEADQATAPTPPETEAKVPAPFDPAAGLPRDEHGDPILPYGDGELSPEPLPYATQEGSSVVPDYQAEGQSTAQEMPYDVSTQRPPPPAGSTEREGDDATGRKRKGGGKEDTGESPQRFALELKFGPYLPTVDANAGADLGAYAQIFGVTDAATGLAVGQPKSGIFSVLGFEWQFIDLAGPLSIGTTIGLFRDKAGGLLVEPDDDGSYRSRADEVRFGVVPVTLLLGYRFEFLADRYRVPFVPYARAGLGYGFWWSKGGDGKVSTNSQGTKGRGGSIGWQANLGMMLRLDFLDRNSTGALDRATGINHTYIFGEYQLSRLNGFGSDKRMSVGDDTWAVGLAVAF